MHRLPLVALPFLAIAATAQTEDAVLEGHSHHGAAFNEGPRQAAYLMEGQGVVQFEVSAQNARARAFFIQGISQLHGFWYLEAERSFRQCAAIEPECAMAYWGMAMANVETEERAKGFAAEAWQRRTTATEREQRYIESIKRYYWGEEEPAKAEPPADKSAAIAASGSTKAKVVEVAAAATGKKTPAPKGSGEYAAKPKPKKVDDKARRRRIVEDLENIVHEYPDDIEAKAFLVNQIWLNNRYGGMQISSRGANQALLDQIFAASPKHPAHHYAVHLWDQKKNAHKVLSNAAVIGHSAPGIAHMWHMGGHIFARLDRHDDAAFQQEASARVDHAHMMRDRVMPDQIHNFAHNNEWLVRSLRHVGRVREAIDLAKNMVELPRHPKFNKLDERGSAYYGRRRILELFEMYELHDEMVQLADTMYLERGEDPLESARVAAALGKAKFALEDSVGVSDEIENLQASLTAARKRRAEAVDKAEAEALAAGKKPAEVDAAVNGAMKEHKSDVRWIHDRIEELRGLELYAEDKLDDAFAKLEGKLAKRGLARLYSAAGRHDKAIELATADAKKAGIALPMANLADIQWRAGK